MATRPSRARGGGHRDVSGTTVLQPAVVAEMVMAEVSEEFAIEHSDAGPATVRVIGEVDLRTAPILADHLERMVHGDGDRDVVIDIAEVTFLDPCGLRILVATHAALQRVGRRLSLLNLSPSTHRVIELADLLALFDLDESEDE